MATKSLEKKRARISQDKALQLSNGIRAMRKLLERGNVEEAIKLSRELSPEPVVQLPAQPTERPLTREELLAKENAELKEKLNQAGLTAKVK